MSKTARLVFCGVMTAALLAAVSLPASALEDGAYTVSRATSYADPETGKTVDGGTNIALGDSMCESIVEPQALVEQSRGKTYVTLGIGLMSNISKVQIQIQGKDGTYRDTEITKTGSGQRNGDTSNHYRFEVDSADNYISPVLYVVPMGRNVQFFVRLDMSTAQPGTGNFQSEMISPENPAENSQSGSGLSSARPEASSAQSTSTDSSSGQAGAESGRQSSSNETGAQPGIGYIIAGIAAAVLAAGAGALIIRKKRKK